MLIYDKKNAYIQQKRFLSLFIFIKKILLNIQQIDKIVESCNDECTNEL